MELRNMHMTTSGWRLAATVAALCAATVAVLLALLPAAPANAAARKSATLTPLTYQVPGRAVASGALALGLKRGFFRDEGIDLKLVHDVPIPQLVPNLLTGRAQLATFTWGTLLSIAVNGVPLVAINQLMDSGKTKETDDIRIVTLANSGIRSIADLKGKTVSIGALGGQGEIAIRYLALRAGLATNDIKFALVQAFDMPAAVRAGRVDAGAANDPYIAQLASQAKIRVLASLSTAWGKGRNIGVAATVTTRDFLSKNKGLVDRYRRAEQRSQAYVRTHVKEFKAFLPGYLNVPASLVKRFVIPNFDPKVNVPGLERYVTIAYNFKKLSRKIDPRSISVLK